MYQIVNTIFNFSHFVPDYPTLGLTVTGLTRVYCNTVSPVPQMLAYSQIQKYECTVQEVLLAGFHVYLSGDMIARQP
jgi:hypothetical protein